MGAGARRNTREHGSEVKAYAAGDLSAAAPEARSAAGQIGSPREGALVVRYADLFCKRSSGLLPICGKRRGHPPRPGL